MKNAEMKRVDILKHCVNVLLIVLFSASGFLFIAYGLLYKNVEFIKNYFDLLFWASAVILSVALVLGILFYFLKLQAPYRLIIFSLICVDFFAVIFYVLCATDILGKLNSISAIREYMEQAGGYAVVLYILFCFLQVILLPVPGSVAVGVGVAMFGPLKCAIFSFIGIVAGSFVAFAVGRYVGYKAVCWIVGKDTLDKWLKKLKGKDYLILSLMFLLPLFPDDVLCFIAGLSSMTWPYFSVMIVITRALSVFSTAYSFDLIPFNTWWGIMIWVILIALIILAFYLVCKYSDQIDKFIKTKFKIKRKK